MLVVASLMSAVYASFSIIMSNRLYATVAEVNRIVQESAGLEVVDAYYISSNSTVVVCLYLREVTRLSIERVYVDGELVNEDNLVQGFGKPLMPEEINCLRFVYTLTQGLHRIRLVTDGGATYDVTIST